MEPPFEIIETDAACAAAKRLFSVVEQQLRVELPPEADIRHIGATAVPGCLTKGDLDIVVRVPSEHFASTDAVLAERYARNTGSIRSDSVSAFDDSSRTPHLGIQLASIGGPHDFFHLFVEALRASPELVTEYNALKRRFDGKDMASYRRAKDAFVERVLGR